MAYSDFPRSVLLATGVLLAAIIAYAGVVRFGGYTEDLPVSTPVVERSLQFEDLPDLGIAVHDASDGTVIATLHGQQGFLRGTLRGLAQQRKRDNSDEMTPFRLTAWADGRLTLDDPVTGRHVELESFGKDNEAVFAQFLPPRGPSK